MDLITLKTELKQELKLTPQLLQSMEILQMNSQELLEYLGKLSEENPVLEQSEEVDLYRAYQSLQQKASWIDAGIYGTTFSHADSAMPEPAATDRNLESLPAFLCDQLDRMHLPKPLLALCKYMAEMIDEDGYLSQEDIDGLEELKIPSSLIDQAVETLQSLDPAGVGARDLSECILLQLARKGNASTAAMDIAAHFLPELSRKHYGPISHKLGLSIVEIQAAGEEIAALEPRPGQAFQPTELPLYIRPDVFIVEIDGSLQVVLNEYYLPRISINSYYSQLCKDTSQADTKNYLRQKLKQAKWLLDSLQHRGSTLRQCTEAILETQRAFFEGSSTELAPMSLSSLAESLQLHPSTISRAVREKYLQCKQGTYSLRYFFSRAVGSQGLSRQAVKQHLLALVSEEDPKHPLSDQVLQQLLEAAGIQVARRTVTKYRFELGIGSSTMRKR